MQEKEGTGEIAPVSASRRNEHSVENVDTVRDVAASGQRSIRIPARLPDSSQAAVSQRLNDVPGRSQPGYSYNVPQHPTHSAGWRTKRHVKRKHLRLSRLRYLETERTGMRALVPMAWSIFSLLLVLLTVFLTVASFVEATQKRYGQQALVLEDILPGDSLKAYDIHGHLIYQMIDQGLQTSVPLKQISRHIINAEVAIEDQNFWRNSGFDITGIARAALDDMTRGHVVSGGSTITQQLIKNVIVGNRESIIRKLQELVLAPDITHRYSKEQILDMYLNTSYYGEQAYGVDAAAFTYFNLQDKPHASAASQLDLAQAAMLAGIPSSPVARDPFLHPAAALTRMQEVLHQMYVQGYITSAQQQQAFQEAQQPGFLHHGVINNRLAPHFVHYALNELAHELHVKVSDLSRAGLIVHTTLDLGLQDQVLKIAQKHIAELAQAHHMSNAAVTVIDYHTGAIRTLLGNINPDDPRSGDYDVASIGFRQPGSSFKPFIYATGFGQDISPGEPVLDEPLTVQMCCGLPSYSPHNYDLRYHGLVTYRYALQNSFNIPAVKLLMKVGVDNALNTAESMGIGPYEGVPNYTMVLGTLSVHLLNETSAYGAFANKGVHVQEHAIETVLTPRGRVIFQFHDPGKQVINPQVAYMMTDVLSDNDSRTFEFGKCSPLLLYTNTMSQCYQGNPGEIRPAAAKTGTSTDFMDNWTVGYTSDFVVGVWAGNNDNSPMVNVSGIDGAAPIWHDTLLLAEKDHPIKPLQGNPPPGLVKETVTYPGLTTTDWHLKQ